MRITMDNNKEINWQERALKAEAQLMKAKLTASFAKDIVEKWPNMTLRTMSTMTKDIDALKEALELENYGEGI